MSDAKHALDRILAIVDRYLEDAEGIGDVLAAVNHDAATVRRALEQQVLPENVRKGYVWFCDGHNSYGDEWFITPNEAADDLNIHIGDTHD